jgi:hypothetical protein
MFQLLFSRLYARAPLIFIMYDHLVQRRQKNGLGEGCAESRPGAGVIDRMFKAAGATCDKNIAAASAKKRLKSYLSEGKKKDSVGRVRRRKRGEGPRGE